jgi:hypothetical protein
VGLSPPASTTKLLSPKHVEADVKQIATPHFHCSIPSIARIRARLRVSVPPWFILLLSLPALARNVDLSTVPKRDSAGKKADLLFEILRHQGHNAKQNNVTLQEAK